MLRVHRDNLSSCNSMFQNAIVLSGSYVSNQTPPFSAPFKYTINIPNTTVRQFTTNQCGYVRLKLKPIPVQKPLQPGYSDQFLQDFPVNITLISPSGIRCLIYSGNVDRSGNSEYIFEDGSINNIDQGLSANNFPASDSYTPKESFLKFLDLSNAYGTWSIEVNSLSWINKDDFGFTLNMDYELTLFMLPKGYNNDFKFPNIPPALSYNASTNLLEYIIHESWFYSGNSLYHTPKLDNLLSFQSQLSVETNPSYVDNVPSNYGLYRLEFPQVILSSTLTANSFINIIQPVSSVWKLNSNLETIEIRSSSLNVIGEYSNTSNSQVIMTVNVPANDDRTIFEFQASVPRWYNLSGPATELYDVNFSIWATYKNGTSRQVYLDKFQKFSMLLLFCPSELTRN